MSLFANSSPSRPIRHIDLPVEIRVAAIGVLDQDAGRVNGLAGESGFVEAGVVAVADPVRRIGVAAGQSAALKVLADVGDQRADRPAVIDDGGVVGQIQARAGGDRQGTDDACPGRGVWRSLGADLGRSRSHGQAARADVGELHLPAPALVTVFPVAVRLPLKFTPLPAAEVIVVSLFKTTGAEIT